MKKYIISALFLIACQITSYSQTTSLISIDSEGRLVYTEDAKGNVIPDYSAVGYENGEESIPDVDVKITLNPVSGDNLAQIQAAIDQVEAMTPDANGIRGAVYLNPGEYEVSDRIYIRESGVVLRGAGNEASGTRLIASSAMDYTLIIVQGSGGASTDNTTSKKLQGAYIPTGAKKIVVESDHSFAQGDRVMLQRKPNQAWISMLGMDVLSVSDPNDTDWTPSRYTLNYKRIVESVNGDTIFLDCPVIDPIDSAYAEGFLTKYTSNNLTNVGVEDMRLESIYASETDENHSWRAVKFENAEHSWARGLKCYHFAYAAVDITSSASNISVIDCHYLEPKSLLTGSRRYSFNVSGQRNLVQNCTADQGRHDYVTGSTTPGPNVFTNCSATNQNADIGPHQRWSTGVLLDQIESNGEQNIQNRLNSGSGHGWTGSSCMIWNGIGSRFRVQSPPNHSNWAIGCTGDVTDDGNWYDGSPGVWESTNQPIIAIPSLYERQLCERLGNTGCGDGVCLSTVSASKEEYGNVATNAIDGDLGTRWAAEGDGEYIEFCLGHDLISLIGIEIAFFDGDKRITTFDILTSVDGVIWYTIFEGMTNSGTTLEKEFYEFPVSMDLKKIRIVGYGNTINNWNSITEVSWVENTCETVSASDQTGGAAINVIDNDLNTRWAAEGNGQYIEFCLGENLVALNGVEVAFFSGDQRITTFDILASQNGAVWDTLLVGMMNSGTTLEKELYEFPEVQLVKNIRIIGYGNTINNWNSITEVSFDFLPVGYDSTAHIIPGIIEAEEYNLGGQNAGYYDQTEGNFGGSFRMEDVDIIEFNTDEYAVSWTEEGEWLNYSINVTQDQEYDIIIRTATTENDAYLHLEVDGIDMTGSMLVPNTGDEAMYDEMIIPAVALSANNQLLTIKIESGDINIDKMIIIASEITGRTSKLSSNRISIYPNPIRNNETLKLRGTSDYDQLQIINQFGGVVYEHDKILDANHKVSLLGFDSGVYIIRITTTGGGVENHRVVVR